MTGNCSVNWFLIPLITDVFNWMQLDTFSFSSNFLNMIQGKEGGPQKRARNKKDGIREGRVELLTRVSLAETVGARGVTRKGTCFTAWRKTDFRSSDRGGALPAAFGCGFLSTAGG